jgi:DNA repair photolyase
MILSVSRRTDIPAFYLEWFFNRLSEGYVLVRNPMNYHQVSKVKLSPSVIDCIVFWTKDPAKIINHLDKLSAYKYYFQITINAYGKTIERNVPQKNLIIDSFKKLSSLVGKERTIWRYDPIILTNDITMKYHYEYFNRLASQLENYTDRCVISFVDLYNKSQRNMKMLGIREISNSEMLEIGGMLSEIANEHNLSLETCCEPIDLTNVGVKHTKCIDDNLISQIIGQKISVEKDKNQRDICGCIASIDIGIYDTCQHGCLYCYANNSDAVIARNVLKHNPRSPLLFGEIEPEDKISERKMETYISDQIDMFTLNY